MIFMNLKQFNKIGIDGCFLTIIDMVTVEKASFVLNLNTLHNLINQLYFNKTFLKKIRYIKVIPT